MRISRCIAAALACGGFVTLSQAADMGTPSGVLGYPAYAPAPLWSGFYLGAHGGYGSANASGTSLDGGLGGIQAGYNTQLSSLVFGVEADISGANISRTDNAVIFGVPASATARTDVLGTLRGRAGVTFGNFMIFGTGGFAWAVNELSGTIGGVTQSDTHLHTGYTFGGGLEWMITPAWTARAEYLYANFGGESYFGGAVTTGRVGANIVRVGVNYMFK
jgi:outer membrane immunogenic protein